MHDPMPIDAIIDRFIAICDELEPITNADSAKKMFQSVHSRLAGGELHIAVIGQFNRGKSSFINELIGEELLPVSVLPLTAIPTELRYGSTVHLTIEFDSDESIEADNHETITATLNRYVTESNNPENRDRVSRVKVMVPSPLLKHGTTIIDTPGFGSTHVHNTKSTIGILKECDAVLFLLSADLPITQMELNFIKQIIPHVTRLFFVYNKTDLLTDEELKTTSTFIRETIEKQLRISTANRFFPVSVKTARHNRDESGLVAIENNVLSFLEREKYFSLAEAIRSKVAEGKTTLVNLIHQREHEINQEQRPLDDAIVELDCVTDNLRKRLSQIGQIKGEQIEVNNDLTLRVQKIVANKIEFSTKCNVSRKIYQSEILSTKRALIATATDYLVEKLSTLRFQFVKLLEEDSMLPPIKSDFSLLASELEQTETPPIWITGSRLQAKLSEQIMQLAEIASSKFWSIIQGRISSYQADLSATALMAVSEKIDEIHSERNKITARKEAIAEDRRPISELLSALRNEIESFQI